MWVIVRMNKYRFLSCNKISLNLLFYETRRVAYVTHFNNTNKEKYSQSRNATSRWNVSLSTEIRLITEQSYKDVNWQYRHAIYNVNIGMRRLRAKGEKLSLCYKKKSPFALYIFFKKRLFKHFAYLSYANYRETILL